MVTKSGTNRFDGSLFEFLENNVLDTRNLFAATNPPLRYNQFGGTLGGPVVRNKLFFFFSYQNTLSPNSTINIHTTPTAAVRSGEFTGVAASRTPIRARPFPATDSCSRIDPVAKAIEAYFPQPTSPTIANNFYNATPQVPKNPYYGRQGGLRPLGG